MLPATGFMRTDYGAIALYRASSSGVILEGSSPSDKELVDAVMYSDESILNPLSKVLTPNSMPVSTYKNVLCLYWEHVWSSRKAQDS